MKKYLHLMKSNSWQTQWEELQIQIITIKLKTAQTQIKNHQNDSRIIWILNLINCPSNLLRMFFLKLFLNLTPTHFTGMESHENNHMLNKLIDLCLQCFIKLNFFSQFLKMITFLRLLNFKICCIFFTLFIDEELE